MDNRSDKTCDTVPATCSDSDHPDTAGGLSDPVKTLEVPSMSDKMFSRFSDFVQKELGIKMPEAKKIMLQARLQKRLRKTGITTFEDYYNYVFSPRGREAELASMIDAVTTNKTDFFREPQHFDYLFYTVLPELASRNMKAVPHSQELSRSQGHGVSSSPSNTASEPRSVPLKIWSAGCASGEEAYTLAMVMSEFASRYPGFSFSILATDISTSALKKGTAGIYSHERIEPIPMPLRKKYLLRSKDQSKELVRMIPELRASVRFQRLNLMDKLFPIRNTMDIIFFRNVLIYFDRPTQESVLNRICQHLDPEGYMFLGHSETLSGLDVPLIPIITAVYRKSF